MNDHALSDLMEAAERSGLAPLAVKQIGEIVRLARVERRLRDDVPHHFAKIEHLAEMALGDAEKAWTWLRRHQSSVAAVPLDLIDRDDGRIRVVQALGRMEHGVYT